MMDLGEWLSGYLRVQEEQQCVKTSFYLLLPCLELVKGDCGLVYDLLPRGVLGAVAGYEQKETRRQINMQHPRHTYL